MTIEEMLNVIDTESESFIKLSDQIWEYAELSLKEYKSAEAYCKLLEELGFTVEKNICGIKTAFSGSFGSGKPVIGILGEFDALSGLSQVADETEKKPLIEGGAGHGCGHNLLGAGALATAYAVKCYLEDNDKSGTVIFYGCPGEEGGSGKAFMAREGLFKELDFSLTWHPDNMNFVVSGTNNSSIQKEYTFHGIAAHAAESPHLGRSALDAVTLMNTGTQFLREHIPPSSLVHYAVTDTGGFSPNVVQAKASVLYMVREIEVPKCKELLNRLDNIAQGAALMTETKLTTRFIDGTANVVPNFTLENLAFECFNKIGAPQYSKEELIYAKDMINSFESKTAPYPTPYNDCPDFVAEAAKEKSNEGEKSLNDFILPLDSNTRFSYGSTDVGDVSWECPTAQVHVVTYPSQQMCHSWQNVSCGKSTIAYKGMLCAAKVLALMSIQLLENPKIIEDAKKEFKIRATDGYVCPIPPEVKPTAI